MFGRKYAGVAIGLLLSIVITSVAMADIIGPNKVTNAQPGWNSQTYPDHTENTTTFSIQFCQSSDGTLVFELMRHWWGLPSTGLGTRNLSCQNNSTWRNASWSAVSVGDYSVEYLPSNPASITTWYKIVY